MLKNQPVLETFILENNSCDLEQGAFESVGYNEVT